jgi:hypothetical protein
VVYEGKSFQLYSIGWLALVTSLAAVTLRLWERKKILPRPYFTLGNGRWYTALELDLFDKEIREHYQGDRDLNKLRTKLGAASHFVHRVYLEAARSGHYTPSMVKYDKAASILHAIEKSIGEFV